MSKVWLVTGSARGLGRDIAEAALVAGNRLIATARDTASLEPLKVRYGDQVHVAVLDVTDAVAARRAVQLAVEAFGRLDVLVNNAGFGHIAPFEQVSEDDFRAQMDANFYGVVNLSRAALPIMRGQRSGCIINVTSVGARMTTPGLSAYQAAKWAVGGFTEVLAQEAASFNVNVVSVEPGAMATGWGEAATAQTPILLPDYQPSVGALLHLLASFNGQAAGDPAKVAQVIVRLADHARPPAHLLLGSDALQYLDAADAARSSAAANWRGVSESTDFAATSPIPAFPE
jgi:NAD(P)-dependent dehydrogenase (short-subunit alcohol dehydrogenase family)